jgi:signal peptidase I
MVQFTNEPGRTGAVTSPGPHTGETMKQGRLKRLARDWIPSLLLLTLLVVARSTLADHYHVPSGSMEPALMPGDHVLVKKAAYGLRIPFTQHVVALQSDPLRGDVVILDSPEDEVRLIKRVVAVGGDHVALLNGRLTINGRQLASPYDPFIEQFGERRVPLNLDEGGGPDISGMVIPEGEVLLLGDHRGASRDGRWFGTVSVEEIYGKASGVFWRKGDGPTWLPL